jgi:peptidoglycan hydrolase CwlO-like protein
MDIEIYKLLIQWGGGVVIIVAMTFFLKELRLFLQTKGTNNISDKLKKIENNDLHEIAQDIDTIQQDISDLKERVTRIETILKIRR